MQKLAAFEVDCAVGIGAAAAGRGAVDEPIGLKIGEFCERFWGRNVTFVAMRSGEIFLVGEVAREDGNLRNVGMLGGLVGEFCA